MRSSRMRRGREMDEWMKVETKHEIDNLLFVGYRRNLGGIRSTHRSGLMLILHPSSLILLIICGRCQSYQVSDACCRVNEFVSEEEVQTASGNPMRKRNEHLADPDTEVERARKLIAETCTDHTISQIETKEDKIVYTGGCTHEEFEKGLLGRKVTGCERKGKVYVVTSMRISEGRSNLNLNLIGQVLDDAFWRRSFARDALWHEWDDPSERSSLIRPPFPVRGCTDTPHRSEVVSRLGT